MSVVVYKRLGFKCLLHENKYKFGSLNIMLLCVCVVCVVLCVCVCFFFFNVKMECKGKVFPVHAKEAYKGS